MLRVVRVSVLRADVGLDDVVACIHHGDDGGVLVDADAGDGFFQEVPDAFSPAVEACRVVVVVEFGVGVGGDSRTCLFSFHEEGAGLAVDEVGGFGLFLLFGVCG